MASKLKHHIQTKWQDGFTLMEVLVAIMILAGSLVVISTSWSGNFARVKKANLYNNVALLLESKMSEITAKYSGLRLEEIPETEAGDFGPDYKQYRWDFKSQEFEMPDMSAILVKNAGPQGADEMLLTMIKQMQNYISESVKEGTVTVYVKGAGKEEVAFSITTYFVDYNRDLQVGGL
ncbi:MAG: type II secretion system protein [Bdellovibrionales bacterium]|nr:type II secretion system protein [Bdellovibrionales bacterium]